MKSKELIKSLTFNRLLKISIFSSLGFSVLYFGIGTIMIIAGAKVPITLNGNQTEGIIGFLLHLAFLPIYFILIFLFEFIVLVSGTWISKRLFFCK